MCVEMPISKMCAACQGGVYIYEIKLPRCEGVPSIKSLLRTSNCTTTGLRQTSRHRDIIAGTTGENAPFDQICIKENVVDQPSPAFCPHCGAAVNLPSSFCGACGQPLQNAAPPAPAAQPQYPPPWNPPPQNPQPPNPQPPTPQPSYGSVPQGQGVTCPFCHSPQVQAGKRGWKWYAGYVGSSNTVWTCQSCGKTF